MDDTAIILSKRTCSMYGYKSKPPPLPPASQLKNLRFYLLARIANFTSGHYEHNKIDLIPHD